ncbi:MAG: hypothetical protein NTW95_13630 [Candidatus Aminicenantes bacterium]|nr:hypothetical protein [Candidatus Aminicenantes bacterium]
MEHSAFEWLSWLWWFCRDEWVYPILALAFLAGYLWSKNRLKNRRNPGPEPFYLFYALLPFAVSLCASAHLYYMVFFVRSYAGSTISPFVYVIGSRLPLLLGCLVAIIILADRCRLGFGSHSLVAELPADAESGNKKKWAGLFLPGTGTAATLLLIATDILIINFMAIVMPLGEHDQANQALYKARLRLGLNWERGASLLLAIFFLTVILLQIARPAHSRADHRSERTVRLLELFLLGAIVIFLFHAISQVEIANWFQGSF